MSPNRGTTEAKVRPIETIEKSIRSKTKYMRGYLGMAFLGGTVSWAEWDALFYGCAFVYPSVGFLVSLWYCRRRHFLRKELERAQTWIHRGDTAPPPLSIRRGWARTTRTRNATLCRVSINGRKRKREFRSQQ